MVSCKRPAALFLSEVYGDPEKGPEHERIILIPVGAFCREHFEQERSRKLAEGHRTAVKTTSGACCWLPMPC